MFSCPREEDKKGDERLQAKREGTPSRRCLRLPCLHFIPYRYLRAFLSHRSYMRPVPRPDLSILRYALADGRSGARHFKTQRCLLSLLSLCACVCE